MKPLDLLKKTSAPGSKLVTVYHGTNKAGLVPVYGKGKEDNDYGSGFYVTTEYDRACEWACGHDTAGAGIAYVYEYQFDMTGLSIFNFYEIKKFVPLVWVTELIQHRKLTGVELNEHVIPFLLKHFSTDADKHDVIIGPRADDSYFTFARAFLQNQIDVGVLSQCLEEGDLGVQYCCKSRESFDRLSFTACHTITGSGYAVNFDNYWDRDGKARASVKQLIDSSLISGSNLTVYNLIRNWKGC